MTTFDFYEKLPTKLLVKVRAGFERDHDAVCGGDAQRQPVEWLRDRINIISRVIEQRALDDYQTPGGKAWAQVETGNAQIIKRWTPIHQ